MAVSVVVLAEIKTAHLVVEDARERKVERGRSHRQLLVEAQRQDLIGLVERDRRSGQRAGLKRQRTEQNRISDSCSGVGCESQTLIAALIPPFPPYSCQLY